MVVAAPWASDPAMPKAELVDGHPDTWAGMINPETVPNVLLFGDGFSGVEADRNAFKAITNKIVHDLKIEPLTRPFDRLANSMNYWRVAVPLARSRDLGTLRGLLVQEPLVGSLAGSLAGSLRSPCLRRHRSRLTRRRWTAKWTIEHLLYAVGLPLPTDVPPADETAEQRPARRDALRAHWAEIVSRDLALPPKEAVLPDTDDPCCTTR